MSFFRIFCSRSGASAVEDVPTDLDSFISFDGVDVLSAVIRVSVSDSVVMVVVVGCADSVTDKEAIADTSVGDI